jgi:hypothetical protein
MHWTNRILPFLREVPQIGVRVASSSVFQGKLLLKVGKLLLVRFCLSGGSLVAFLTTSQAYVCQPPLRYLLGSTNANASSLGSCSPWRVRART